MIITGINGVSYSVCLDNDKNFEIEREDEATGLRKVFVFQDLSIGSLASKRKEVVFYSYDIVPTGGRINERRHSFTDIPEEFDAFIESEVWAALRTAMLTDFLKKIEFTEIQSEE